MALYSVWDWDRNAWAVYRDARPVSVGDDPKPPKPLSVHPLGADPDTQVKPLPSGARFVEFSHVCRGEVRRAGGALASLGLDPPAGEDLPKYLLGVAVGAALVWWMRKSR